MEIFFLLVTLFTERALHDAAVLSLWLPACMQSDFFNKIPLSNSLDGNRGSLPSPGRGFIERINREWI